MIEADRILDPVAADAPAIRALREYASPAALADALREASAAVEHSLRLLLRSDRGAGEADRMRAMSPQELPFHELVERLRARGLITIELAGTVHELRRAIEGGRAVTAPTPDDADRALEVVARLRGEVRALADSSVREAAHHTVESHLFEEETSEVPGPAEDRRRTPIGVALAVVALVVVVFMLLRGMGDPLDDGIEAFRRGDLTEAAAKFREAVADDESDPTPRLYLGRVYRRLDRHAEAGDQLERAARLAPRDADIRRELGYLFTELRSYPAAVRQFEQAVELEPAEDANWLGLVRAQRLAGDRRAEETLARAPAAVRAVLAGERRPADVDDAE